MIITAVVPLLLIPAAPLTLAEQAIRPRTDGSIGAREVLAGIGRHLLTPLGRDPYLAVLILAGAVLAIYYSPMLEWSAHSQLGYSTMTLLALLAGCLFTYAVTGPPDNADSSPAPRLALVVATAVLYEANGWWLSTQAFTNETPWTSALNQSAGTATNPVTGSAGPIMWSLGFAALAVLATIVLTRRNSRNRVRDGPDTAAREQRDGSHEKGLNEWPIESGGH
jgi:cytochrome c oxidase assembly factor CtaG